MKILFLCNKSPWPPVEGGPMAMNMLIEGLVAAGHTVKVLAVNSHKYNINESLIPAGYREATRIELIDVNLRINPVEAFRHLFTGRSYHVERFISARFRDRLAGVLKQEEFDIVQLETLFMTPYIPVIRAFSRARVVLRAHNIEHRIWERIAENTAHPLKKWYLKHLAGSLGRYERRILGGTDGIAAITPDDAAWFRETAPAGTAVIDLPFGTDPARYDQPEVTTEFPSLFSLGSMNWIPNLEGIRWFLDQVWPEVHREFPELTYYLAGRHMPGWMRELKIPGVKVLGEVEDAPRFLASKAIMIVPLFSGSGIRIKIIEGMAAGKAIISTRIGAEGIRCTPQKDILIADMPCEFFEAISILVRDPALYRKLGENARSLIESDYRVESLIGKLAGFYQELGR